MKAMQSEKRSCMSKQILFLHNGCVQDYLYKIVLFSTDVISSDETIGNFFGAERLY